MLQYHRSDELPAWEANVTINGAGPAFSTGFTFTCVLKDSAGTVALTKTTGITGTDGSLTTAGVITVAWAASELDLTPGRYTAHLIYTRTSGTLQKTVAETIEILARNV